MRALRSTLVGALLFAGAVAGQESGEDVFRSEVAALQVAKPAGWVYQSLERLAAGRASIQMKDQEMQATMEQLATAPLLVATRHPEPYETLNPSFQVLVRPLAGPLEGASGRDILNLIVPKLHDMFADVQQVGDIADVEVDGLPGARLTAEYLVQTRDGASFRSRAVIVIVPRGSYMYQFSFSAPPTGPDALTGEVEATLASVDFLDSGE